MEEEKGGRREREKKEENFETDLLFDATIFTYNFYSNILADWFFLFFPLPPPSPPSYNSYEEPNYSQVFVTDVWFLKFFLQFPDRLKKKSIRWANKYF